MNSTMRPIFNESFVEKKKNCRSREQCMKSTGKVEMCFSKKKKKKNGGMLDANAIQTFTKWRLSTSHNKGRGNGNLKYITSIYIYGLMVAIKA